MSAKLAVRIKKSLVALLVAAGMIISTLAVTTSPAAASATNCARWGAIQLWKFKVASGQYCFTVVGDGATVHRTQGSFNTGWIYNPSERVVFYDQRNRQVASFWTYSRTGLLGAGNHFWHTGINGTAPLGGRACGEFYSSGQLVASTCNAIR